MVVQLLVVSRSQDRHDIAAAKVLALAVDRRKELRAIAQRHALFRRGLKYVELGATLARELDEALHAASIRQRRVVETQPARHALTRLSPHLPPSSARALEGVEHEVDAYLRRARPPRAVEHRVAIAVELEATAAVQVSHAPLRPQLPVLLPVFGLGLVEGQRLV